MAAESETVYTLISDIIFLAFCAVAICADLTIVGTIVRYKKLRSSAPNVLLANWAIADILCMLVTPTAYDASILFRGKTKNKPLLFAIFKLGISFHINMVLCVLLLTSDWLLTACYPKIRDKLTDFYKYIISVLWILCIPSTYFSLTQCSSYKCVVNEPELILIYCALSLCVVVAQCYRCVKPAQHSSLPLHLATLFLATWILGFANLLYIRWIVKHPLVSTLLNCITFSTSVVNLLMLLYFNNDFYACFNLVCTKSDKKYAVPPF